MATDKNEQINQTEQNILNKSQDTTFKVLAFEMLGYNPTASTLNRVKVNASGELVAVTTLGTGADDVEGAPVSVGTTAVELTFSGATTSIFIQSDPDNTGKVWIGKANVTNAGANAMVQLGAGDSISLDLDDASNALYAISDTASQNVFKMALV